MMRCRSKRQKKPFWTLLISIAPKKSKRKAFHLPLVMFQNNQKSCLYSENNLNYSSIFYLLLKVTRGDCVAETDHERLKQGQDQNSCSFGGPELGRYMELFYQTTSKCPISWTQSNRSVLRGFPERGNGQSEPYKGLFSPRKSMDTDLGFVCQMIS